MYAILIRPTVFTPQEYATRMPEPETTRTAPEPRAQWYPDDNGQPILRWIPRDTPKN